MSNLVIVVIMVDSQPFIPVLESYPVILYGPYDHTPWQQILDQISQAGAIKVLLQFSNESITVPEHEWNFLDFEVYRYARLYPAADLLKSSSPLTFIDLYPTLPLCELQITTRPILDDNDSFEINRCLYYFQTSHFDELQRFLDGEQEKARHHLLDSIVYSTTNRFEEAYLLSKKALSQSSTKDNQMLWLVHGLNAAACNHDEEAKAAFHMSYTENHRVESIYIWADHLMSKGYNSYEIINLLKPRLVDDSYHAALIGLYYRIGANQEALDLLEAAKEFDQTRAQTDPDSNDSSSASVLSETSTFPTLFTHLHFNCLIRLGRVAEAILMIREQAKAYFQRYPADALLADLILADGKLEEKVSQLPAPILEAVQERAVQVCQFELAKQLQAWIAEPLSLAKTLYRYGYVMRSANYFIDAMPGGQLDPEGYRYLAEILYRRRAYDQSTQIFEYILSQLPDDGSIRTALALASLRKSEQLLDESMHIFPSSAFLREEAAKVAESIKRMEQSKAITGWRWSERNNFHE